MLRDIGVGTFVAGFGPVLQRPPGVLRAVFAAGVLLVLMAPAACDTSPQPTTVPQEGTPVAVAVVTGACASASDLVPVPESAAEEWQAATASRGTPCFRLRADATGETTIPVDTTFVLSSAVDLTSDQVHELLVADPPVDFDVTLESSGASAVGKGLGLTAASPGLFGVGASVAHAQESLPYAYRVSPRTDLPEGETVRFAFLDRPGGRPLDRWAFPVRAPLRVIGTLPRDRASDVPTDVGIELTFSHDGVTGAQTRLVVEPDVAGRVELHGRTVVLVPDAPLSPATLYTVRLEPGVTVPGSDLGLEQPYVFRFETGQLSGASTDTQPRFSRHVWEQPSAEAPVLSLFGLDPAADGSGLDADLRVLAYRDAAAFAAALDAFAVVPGWSWYARAAYRADKDELSVVAEFAAAIEPLGQYGEFVLRFPEALDPGFYLVDAEIDGEPSQTWLQVTDLATYAAVSWTKTLVWVNDVASGAPVGAARVTGSGWSGSTDADGMVVVDTPEALVSEETTPWGGIVQDAVGTLLVSDDDGRQAVVPLSDRLRGSGTTGFHQWGAPAKGDVYWRYLYTDRKLYRPTDTLRFWGVARARDGGRGVDRVELSLTGGDFTVGNAGEVVLDRVSAAVTDTGTYLGELQIEGASPGWYTVHVHVGDVEIGVTGVEVRDFVKPAYRLQLSPDRRAVLDGQALTMTVSAAFFEGSPVPGVAIRVAGDTEAVLTTDKLGRAELSYTAPAPGQGPFNTTSVYVAPVLAEEGQIEATGIVVVVPSEVALRVAATVDGATGVVSGTVHGVDLSLVNDDPERDPSAFVADPLEGRSVLADVIEIRYVEEQVGTTYDFVNKQTRPVLRYDRVETAVGTFEAVSDRDGRFAIEFPVDAELSYEIDVRSFDDDARETVHSLYAGARTEPSSNPYVALEAEKEGPYGIGDPVRLRLVRGSDELPDGDRYLFFEAQNGIRFADIVDVPEHTFTFDEARVPNVIVVGIRFDGRTFEETSWGYSAAFDTEPKALSVLLEAERERYAPGEEVNLSVTVRDHEDRPVSARVLLSAVDEAIAAMQYGNEGDAFLQALYGSVGSGVVSTYASHQVPLGASGAEGGGGGGERADFRDVVLFEEVTTDDDGRAQVSFDLPDNLTSWSVTGLAVSAELQAGSGRASVPVGLPFFVDLTMNDTYLVADRPEIRLRAFGDGLSSGDPVTFKLIVEPVVGDIGRATADEETDDAGASRDVEPITAEGTAFEGTDVPLPPLAEGRYLVRVAGRSGALDEDALARPLLVRTSHLVATESQYAEVAAGAAYMPPDGVAGPVTLAVADANRGRYHRDLRDLTSSSGDRLDQVLGREVAGRLLVQSFGDPVATGDANVAPYRAPDGGLALLPFGDVDLDLSVLASAVAPNDVGRQGMVSYLWSVMLDPDETMERQAAALWGLAALGEPVLGDVRALLSTADLGVVDRLHLGLAAAASGDTDLGASVFGRLVDEVGEQRGPFARFNVGGDDDAVLRATALGAVLGASVADGLSTALYGYTGANAPDEIVLNLERVAFLQQALPRLPEAESHVTFSLFGETRERVVGSDAPLTLFLSPDDLATLDLTVTDGRVGVSAARDVAVDSSTVVTDPAVAVTRSYDAVSPTGEPRSGDSEEDIAAGEGRFDEGDLVRVRLEYELGEGAEDGCYQLSDFLPSGLRASTSTSDPVQMGPEAGRRYPYAIEGQRVSFCVYADDQEPVAVYYARVLNRGAFAAEPAMLQSMQAPESLGVSGGGEVVIR